MSEAREKPAEVDLEQLEQLVAEADTGGRHAAGNCGARIVGLLGEELVDRSAGQRHELGAAGRGRILDVG